MVENTQDGDVLFPERSTGFSDGAQKNTIISIQPTAKGIDLLKSVALEYPALPNRLTSLPQFGKPDSYDSCDLVVLMKDSAYFRHNGLTGEEPAAKFKEWMVKHQHDPEHGKNEPVAAPEPAAAGAPGASAPK